MTKHKTRRTRESPAGGRLSGTRAAKRPRRSYFPVVGVGASAGGLEAFTRFLSSLPRKTGMAFLLVQHLDPTHPSLLPGLLAKVTALPVIEMADGMPVKPDHVYVIPPNVDAALVNGILQFTPRGDAHALHLPVNCLLHSLARDRQSRAIGVILSGAGADGALGITAIRAAGGMTFAQEETSARHTGMPHSAISTGCVDLVLPPEEIARALGRGDFRTRHRPATVPAASLVSEDDYGKIIGALRAAYGVDFSQYRDTTIKRRIARRMALQKQETLAQYVRFTEAHPEEITSLYRDTLINVSSFFRDPEVFEAIKADVFPRIVKGKSPQTPIRIWVPGCAAGQEAYSLAMVLLEVLDSGTDRPPIQIFGTDINDPVAIDAARSGLYPRKIEAEVSPQRLGRFFTREEGGYRISKEIREMCVFARQNIAADPPFSRLDLISCRNLLIYLSASLQKRIFPTFHYALNPGGYLVLGTSETVGSFTDLFEPLSKKHTIYRSR